MDAWADREREAAPELRPTDEMRRLVEAKRQRREPRPRWGVWGAGVAALAASLVACAWLVRAIVSSGEPESRPVVVAVAPPLKRGDVSLEGPAPAPEWLGRKKGPDLDELLLQQHVEGSGTIRGLDLLAGDTTEIRLEPDAVYRLFFRPQVELHVLVFQDLEGGEPTRLFPPAAEEPAAVPAGRGRFLPAEPRWFSLEGTAGGRVFVVHSREPLVELNEQYEDMLRVDDATERGERGARLLARLETLAIEGDPPVTILVLPLRRR